MTDDIDDLMDEFLSFVFPQDMESLSKAEQIGLGKSLLQRLENSIEELRQNPEQAGRGLSRRHVSPDLPQLIGEVVIAASWAEDAGGTLIQASSGDWEVRAKGYDDTSNSLVKALKKMVPKELTDRLTYALSLRHFVVHGFWADGSFYKHPQTGKPFDFIVMKRSWKTPAPEREVKAFTKNALKWLAQEFWEIEAELEALHSAVLFGQAEDTED